MKPPQMFWIAAYLLAFLALGCTSNSWNATMRTGMRITPEYFQFAEVVPEDVRGGWRAVCIVAKVGQRVAHPQTPSIDTETTCDIEVGVPISNESQGYFSLGQSQKISAEVANESAYAVLEHSAGLTTYEICKQIMDAFDYALRIAIEGSRVTKCGVTKWRYAVPVVYWPGDKAKP